MSHHALNTTFIEINITALVNSMPTAWEQVTVPQEADLPRKWTSTQPKLVLQTEHLGLEVLQLPLYLMCSSIAVTNFTQNGKVLVPLGSHCCLQSSEKRKKEELC